MFRKRRCWYCLRVGRFGWKKLPPTQGQECKDDRQCFINALETRGG